MRRLVGLQGKGFSLIEVVIAIGIVAFVLTGLLATFPAGLGAENASQHESRATQFASIVLGSLQGAPFHDVPCFGERLDLAQLDSAGESPAVELFGCISAIGEVEIRRISQGEADYHIRFHFEPRRRAGRVEASCVSLAITPRNSPGQTFYFSTIVGNFGS